MTTQYQNKKSRAYDLYRRGYCEHTIQKILGDIYLKTIQSWFLEFDNENERMLEQNKQSTTLSITGKHKEK